MRVDLTQLFFDGRRFNITIGQLETHLLPSFILNLLADVGHVERVDLLQH